MRFSKTLKYFEIATKQLKTSKCVLIVDHILLMLFEPSLHSSRSNIENENSAVRGAHSCVFTTATKGRSRPITTNLEFIIAK